MADVTVQGAEAFLALSKYLKRTGQLELRKSLNKQLKAAAKPLVKEAKSGARAGFPQRGGAAAFIAGKKHEIKVKTGVNPGVSVAVIKQDPRIEDGRLAHPVFNRRGANGKRLVAVQQVKSGVYSDALRDATPAIRKDVMQVLEDVAADALRAVR